MQDNNITQQINDNYYFISSPQSTQGDCLNCDFFDNIFTEENTTTHGGNDFCNYSDISSP